MIDPCAGILRQTWKTISVAATMVEIDVLPRSARPMPSPAGAPLGQGRETHIKGTCGEELAIGQVTTATRQKAMLKL